MSGEAEHGQDAAKDKEDEAKGYADVESHKKLQFFLSEDNVEHHRNSEHGDG